MFKINKMFYLPQKKYASSLKSNQINIKRYKYNKIQRFRKKLL